MTLFYSSSIFIHSGGVLCSMKVQSFPPPSPLNHRGLGQWAYLCLTLNTAHQEPSPGPSGFSLPWLAGSQTWAPTISVPLLLASQTIDLLVSMHFSSWKISVTIFIWPTSTEATEHLQVKSFHILISVQFIDFYIFCFYQITSVFSFVLPCQGCSPDTLPL